MVASQTDSTFFACPLSPLHTHHHRRSPLSVAPAPSRSGSRHLISPLSPSLKAQFVVSNTYNITARSPGCQDTSIPFQQPRRSSAWLGNSLKSPLTPTSNSDMNGMKLRSTSASPNTSPTKVRQPGNRQPNGETVTNASHLHRAGSPLKRSEGTMNSGDSSSGSPVSKRRSLNGPLMFASTTPLRGASPRPTAKRQPISPNNTDPFLVNRPIFAKSRQKEEFVHPSVPASKMRRITSVESFGLIDRGSPFNTRVGPLPNASAHYDGSLQQLPYSNHPLSTTQTLNSTTPSPAQSNTMGTLDFTTPQAYKNAKPDPTAFHSTGFVSKRNRRSSSVINSGGSGMGVAPETPCKRNLPFAPAVEFHLKFGPKIPMRDLGTPHSTLPLDANDWGSPVLIRDNGFVRSDSEDSDLAMGDSPLSNMSSDAEDNDLELPPTPTRRFNGYSPESISPSKRLKTHDGVSRFSRPLKATPQTPASSKSLGTLDASNLSISHQAISTVPATPGRPKIALDPSGAEEKPRNLTQRFSFVKVIGTGAFSEVFQVADSYPFDSSTLSRPNPTFSTNQLSHVKARFFAVKALKNKRKASEILSASERMQEVTILQKIASSGFSPHIIQYYDSWQDGEQVYIQTEFCSRGSFAQFLEDHGEHGRLDEFRVWKILLELSKGLSYIHDHQIMHLDIKPSNILIADDGSLKIADFGMAVAYPAPKGTEREGDKVYLSPEVMYGKLPEFSADIFSLGITMIEIAGNEDLPIEGENWQRLRDGHLDIVPRLSTTGTGEFVHRDDEGNPVSTENLDASLDAPLHVPRPQDLVSPPQFMKSCGLEKIVSAMCAVDPMQRPSANDIICMDELKWVASRMQRPATLWEGLWGPANILQDTASSTHDSDTEMS